MSFEGVGPVFFKGISHVTATPVVDVGTERIVAGEKYVYVYNCGGTSAGMGVALSRPVSAAAGIYSCSVSAASGDLCVGFVKHVAIPSGEYGWALKRGLVTVAVASSASDQAAGAKAIGGGDGRIVTNTAGYFLVGELTTAIVSGNSGALYVQLA